MHRDRAEIERVAAAGEVQLVGTAAVDYMGVPLRTEGHTIGVLAVQSYVEGQTYSDADEQLLIFVAEHSLRRWPGRGRRPNFVSATRSWR